MGQRRRPLARGDCLGRSSHTHRSSDLCSGPDANHQTRASPKRTRRGFPGEMGKMTRVWVERSKPEARVCGLNLKPEYNARFRHCPLFSSPPVGVEQGVALSATRHRSACSRRGRVVLTMRDTLRNVATGGPADGRVRKSMSLAKRPPNLVTPGICVGAFLSLLVAADKSSLSGDGGLTGHHHPKAKLPIQARVIATSANKPMMAPTSCGAMDLSLTGCFIA
jgi:hypothetical protein